MDEQVKNLLVHYAANPCALCDSCYRGFNPCKFESDAEWCRCTTKQGMICGECKEAKTTRCTKCTNSRLLCAKCHLRCYAKGACVCNHFLPNRVRKCERISPQLREPLATALHQLLVADAYRYTGYKSDAPVNDENKAPYSPRNKLPTINESSVYASHQ